ncbi:MAG TPA: nuclear transport factor 2 family protein [Gaiellaceae bacterium]|nr:nuclear transport factor 2 family protein [Gaiellaceae bacterium]
MSDLAEQLQALLDERGVVDTLHRWSDAFYKGDVEGVLDCFTENGSFSMTRAADKPPNLELSGKSELTEWMHEHEARVPPGKASQIVAHPRVGIDGDRAESACFFVVIHNIDGAPTLFSTGRFYDSLERCDDGRWRIAARRGVGEMRREKTS